MSDAELRDQAERIAELEAENQELTDELFRPQDLSLPPLDTTQGPYSGDDDMPRTTLLSPGPTPRTMAAS